MNDFWELQLLWEQILDRFFTQSYFMKKVKGCIYLIKNTVKYILEYYILK